MSGTPRTTWEDLARLGHTRRAIFLLANARRGGTMANESHLHLNNDFVDQYGWYSYNVIKGQAQLVGSRPTRAESTTTRNTWDNTQNDRPQSESWSETVTLSSSASLSTTTSASMTLSQSITIYGVATSEFSLTVGTETNTSTSSERVESVTRSFTIEVGPHERLQLIRTQTTLGQVATYQVPYGLNDNALVGTQGERYNGHYHYGYYLNDLLNWPTGRIELNGTATDVDYTFELIRTGGTGPITSKARVVFNEKNGRSIEVPMEIKDGAEAISEGRLIGRQLSGEGVPGL